MKFTAVALKKRLSKLVTLDNNESEKEGKRNTKYKIYIMIAALFLLYCSSFSVDQGERAVVLHCFRPSAGMDSCLLP